SIRKVEFKLYDTNVFLSKLTDEIANQVKLILDINHFEEQMQKQRDRARQARQNSQPMQVQCDILKKITTDSQFVGYDVMDQKTIITDIIYNGELVNEAESGETIYFILKETPFYAVSGGQVADEG